MIAEARFLAERLRELVDAGDAERGEIVVLLRAFTHVDAYEQALARAGLRPFVVGGRGYWTQQQVEDLIRLLGVVSNPLDDELLFGALASFAAGVSPDALWLLRQAARGEQGGAAARLAGARVALRRRPRARPGRSASGSSRSRRPTTRRGCERFCAILARLRAEAPLLTLEELVERTMTAFGYDLGLIARDGGAGRMANVRKLMRLAREFEASEGRDLAGFLALAAESTERDEREGMAAVQAEGHDGVRVMTVHAAKGLQFPVVAVPDLGRGLDAGHRARRPRDRPAAGRRRRAAALRDAPRVRRRRSRSALWELAELNDAESDAEAEEGCRLVYVAASRAEDRLILSGVYKRRRPRARRGAEARATRRSAGCCRPSASAAGTGGDGARRAARPAADRHGATGSPTRALEIRDLRAEPRARRRARARASIRRPSRSRSPAR